MEFFRFLIRHKASPSFQRVTFLSYPKSLLNLLCCNSLTIKENNDLRPFLHSRYRNFFGSTSTFQHQFNCLLFFDSLYLVEISDTFPRSTESISTYTLSCLSLVLLAWRCPPAFWLSHHMVFHNKNSY